MDESRAISLTVDSAQRDEVVQIYNLQMPDDLFHFWDFCKELYSDNPCGMFFNDQYLFSCIRTNANIFVDYYCGEQISWTSAVFI